MTRNGSGLPRRGGPWSIVDLAAGSRKSTASVLGAVKAALAAGAWEFKGKRPGRGIDGRLTWVPTYGPVGAPLGGPCEGRR